MKINKKFLIPFVSFWILNTVLLYLAGNLFPQYFTLGTWRLSPVMAVIISGLIWTTLVWFSDRIIAKLKIKKELQIAAAYFVLNFVALWIVARLAPYDGFGTVRFVWILLLAFVGNLLQFGVWKIFSNLK